VWKQQFHLILKKQCLEKYIYQKILIKINGAYWSNEQKAKLILVDDTLDTYYAKFTKNNTVIQDTKAKEILINSISKSWLKI
jgi:hypothetical protein